MIEFKKFVVAKEFPESLNDGFFNLSVFCEFLIFFSLAWLNIPVFLVGSIKFCVLDIIKFDTVEFLKRVFGEFF